MAFLLGNPVKDGLSPAPPGSGLNFQVSAGSNNIPAKSSAVFSAVVFSPAEISSTFAGAPKPLIKTARRYVLVVISSLCLGHAGCSWTDSGGTHHLIVGVGFGIVTTTNCPGVDVRDSHIFGGELGPDFVGLGWMQHHRVVINPALASNAVVFVQASPPGISVKNFDPYGSNTSPNRTTNNPTTKQ